MIRAALVLFMIASTASAGTFSDTGNARPCGFIIYGDSKTDGITSDWPKVIADMGYSYTLAGHGGAKMGDLWTSDPVAVPPVQRQMFRTGGACQEDVTIFGGATGPGCLEDMAANGQLRSCMWVIVDTGTNDSTFPVNWAARDDDYELWAENIIDEVNSYGLNLAFVWPVPIDPDGDESPGVNEFRNLSIATMGETNFPNAIASAGGVDPMLIDTYTPLMDILAREGEDAFALLYDAGEVHPRGRGVELVGKIIIDAIESEHTRRLGIPTAANGGTFR